MTRGWPNIDVIVALMCVLGPFTVAAQEERAAEPAGPLTYRRIFVLQDELQSQAAGLLPMKREEFEKRLLTAGSSNSREQPAECRIESGVYRATFENQQLVAGQADLKVHCDAARETWLSFEGSTLAIGSAFWTDSLERPALLGLDSSGRTTLRVERSSTLELEWSARGQPIDRGGWRFDLTLPPAIHNELQIELPSGWTMSAEAGLLSQVPQAIGENEDERIRADVSGTAAWRLELGGQRRAEFSVYPRSAGRDETLLLVSEAATYRFAPGSLDSDLSLTLNIHEHPLRQVALRVEPPLDILSIRHKNTRLDWQEGAPDEAGVRRLILELPEPLPPGTHMLQINATAAWPLDRQIAVPRIQVEGGIWQHGSATMVSSSDLRISPRSVSGANQTKSMHSGGNGQARSMQFEYYSGAARVEMVATRPLPGLRVQSGLAVVVDGNQATATLMADLSTDVGERFEFSGSASRRWIIESVETVPADLLEERRIEVQGPDQQRLSVRLRHPLTDKIPVRLIVRARRQQTGEGRTLPVSFLQLLSFDDLREQRRLVSVNSVDPALEPKLIADADLERLDPGQATSADLDYFESAPGPILFESKSNDASGRLTLRRGEPRFATDIEHSVVASQGALAHEVRISIRPESSTISSVLVRATPEPSAEIAWSIEGDDSRIVVPKSSGNLAPPDSPISEQAWRLQLQRPRSGAIAIVGRWTQPLEGTITLPLFSLPEATSQSGTVQIHSSGGVRLQLTPDDMVAMPLPPAPPGEINPVFARYRYEPGRRGALILTDTPSDSAAPANLFIRREEIRSTFSSDGSASHVGVYELENLGAERFSLTLPKNASLERVTVDGQPASVTRQAQENDQLAMPLPAAHKQPRVEIHYSSRGGAEQWWTTRDFVAPLPQPHSPSLERRWVVHLAPTLRLWSDASSRAQAQIPDKPINLFSAASWKGFLTPLGLGATESKAKRSDSLGAGWQTHQLTLPSAGDAVITVYRPALMHVIGIASALTAFALIGALAASQQGKMVLTALLCLIATTCWFLPEPMAPIVWWTLAGLVSAIAWLGLRAPAIPSSTATPSSQPPITTSLEKAPSLTTLLLFAIALTMGNLLQAAEDEPATSKRPPRVIIPIDDDRQPTGDYVYLTETFYERLHRPAESAATSVAYLIRSASYDATVTEDETTALPQGCEFSAHYELETFVDDALVTLPLGRGDVHLIESGSTLDRRPLVVGWNELRDALSFQIPQTGRHRIDLRFVVAFRRQEQRYTIDLRVPTITESRARVEFPADRGECEISAPLGAQDLADEAGIITAQLGPANRLRVEYRPNRKSEEQSARVSVDQRIWWKIRPGSVVADGRFEFASTDGELRELVLQTDPQVKLLPLDSDAGIARQWVEEGSLNTIHLELAPPYPTEASLHATFLVVGATGSGAFLPPLIEAETDTTIRNWHAVSVIPGWQVEGLEPGLSPDQFARAWSGTMEVPDLAWDRTVVKSAPTLSVRPAAERSVAFEHVDYSIGRTTSIVHYKAEIQPGIAAFQFAVAVPPMVRVRTVTAEDARGPLQIQSWRSSDGVVTVALAEALDRKFDMTIEADFETPAQRSFLAPLVALLDVDSSNYFVRVFRRSDAKVQIGENSGFAASDSSVVGSFVAGLGRLVQEFEVDDEASSRQLRLVVSANTPELTGRLFTVLSSQQERWNADVHAELVVQGGVVDSLRLELPENWNGPFEIQPAVEHSLLSIPGQTRKQLLIRPQRAIEDRMELVISASLSSANDNVRCPDVDLLEAPAVARYVALPAGETTQLTWETSGMQAAMVDAATWPGKSHAQRFEFFQVVSNRFEAVARRAADTLSQPSVSLADVEITWQADRRYFGTVRFDMLPGGLADCVLAVPPHCELTAVTLDSGMANLKRISDRAMHIGLGRRKLPLRLSATFQGRAPLSDSGGVAHLNFAAPSLEGMPATRTLWTIHAPQSFGDARSEQATLISASEQNIERLRSCLLALESGPESLSAETLGTDVRNWASTWNRRFEAIARRLDAMETSDTSNNSKTLAQLQSRLLTRTAKLSAAVEPPADDALASGGMRTVADTMSLRLQAEGPLSAVEVQYAVPSGRSSGVFVAGSLLIILVTILGLLSPLPQRQAAMDWIKRNAWMLLALSGVVVWLAFPLGVFGWGVVATAVILAHWTRPWRYALST